MRERTNKTHSVQDPGRWRELVRWEWRNERRGRPKMKELDRSNVLRRHTKVESIRRRSSDRDRWREQVRGKCRLKGQREGEGRERPKMRGLGC